MPNAMSATPRMLSVRLTDGAGFRGMIGVIAITDFIRVGAAEDLTKSVFVVYLLIVSSEKISLSSD
jgi:hypothetical protein